MIREHATEWVFAYGSNLHIEDLKHWLRHYGYCDQGIIQGLPAILDDYRLVWNYSPVRQGGGRKCRAGARSSGFWCPCSN